MEKEIYQTGEKRKDIRERWGGKKARVEGVGASLGMQGGSGCTGSPEQGARSRQSAALWGKSQMFLRV